MTINMPFGDIEIYDRAPHLGAEYELSAGPAAKTSQWDLAEKAIDALLLMSDWLIPLVVEVAFEGDELDETTLPNKVVLWSRETPDDVTIKRQTDSQHVDYVDLDTIDREALRSAFASGLGDPTGEAGQPPFDRPVIRWQAIRVLVSRILVGPAVEADHITIRDWMAQPMTFQLRTIGGQNWMETKRRDEHYPPMSLFIGNEFFEPLLVLAMTPNWSLYGHINGQQTHRIHDYLAKLTELGWKPDFRPSEIEPPFYQFYLEAEQQREAARLKREARQPKRP